MDGNKVFSTMDGRTEEKKKHYFTQQKSKKVPWMVGLMDKNRTIVMNRAQRCE